MRRRDLEMESMLKKTLKFLCCSNGWSYGVFWRFDHSNSMLLTLEDAYCEEHMRDVIDSMLLQVHLLGEGIVGQAAFDGKHQWMFSDAQSGGGNSLGYGESQDQDIFQDDSEIRRQFGSGIKTIAVISVEPQGVVQFGSTQRIVDSLEFLDQTRRSFREMEYVDGLFVSRNTPPILLHDESYNSSGLLASLVSSGSTNYGNLTPKNPLQPLFLHSTTLVNRSANTPCNSTWSREDSSVASLEQQFPSEMVKASPSVFPTKPYTQESYNNSVQNLQGGSIFISLRNTSKLLECSNPFYAAEGEFLESSSSMLTFQDEFPAELPSSLPKSSYQVDDISQGIAPSPDHRINVVSTTLDEDLSQAIGVTSVSSGKNGAGVFIVTPANHPANSLQSSVTNTFKTDVKERILNTPVAENGLFDCFGGELGFAKMGEIWEDFAVPVVNGGQSTVRNGMSERSELDVCSMAVPRSRRGLFSELGLEQLLDEIVGNSNHVCKSTSEDQPSTNKRRKTGSYSVNGNPIQFAGLSCLSENTNFLQPLDNLANTTNLEHQKVVLPKSHVGLWIDDSDSDNGGGAVMTQPKRPEEPPAKATKKRARPGESTRARPKDRQQIQDRLSELREIIPSTVKLSIDSLLDRTIKHMLFLQSVAKHADRLKQVDDPKLIGQENGVVLKDNANGHGGGGATWAYEVGGQTMICPIILEDLSPPGQMLIEMLCEEQGLFLEIAAIVRGFGLNILKGVIEVRENKIWARFIVEANTPVTRMDIFWSLIHLLQQPASNENDSTKQLNNTLDGKTPLFSNYQQLPFLHPVSLVDTLR